MAVPKIIVTDLITADMQRAIGAGLDAFNDEVTGYADRLPLAVLARDPSNEGIIGGALGRWPAIF